SPAMMRIGAQSKGARAHPYAQGPCAVVASESGAVDHRARNSAAGSGRSPGVGREVSATPLAANFQRCKLTAGARRSARGDPMAESDPSPNGSTGPIPRPEYPRPSFVRDEWLNLNGSWQFAFDPGDSGRDRGLVDAELPDRITVPFCPESA